MKFIFLFSLAFLAVSINACSQANQSKAQSANYGEQKRNDSAEKVISSKEKLDNNSNKKIMTENNAMPATLDTTVLGAGCFWCVEAVFQNLKGVTSVLPGYSGGTVLNPTYKQVCGGTTGHAEVAQIIFDKTQISFQEILEVFFKTHDPTTMNRQGADEGTQYRSAIFYNSQEQKQVAEQAVVDAQKYWDDKIVTEITKLDKFYVAEDYHQNYYNNNKEQSYCKFVINPKIQKFKKEFKDKIKDSTKENMKENSKENSKESN